MQKAMYIYMLAGHLLFILIDFTQHRLMLKIEHKSGQNLLRTELMVVQL